MTYHYKYWTAFREADLLSSGDNNINHGDTFVMPGSPTITLAAYDNDGSLSGDYRDRATDSAQNGWVRDAGGHWQNTHSRFFVEKTWTLQGSDGNTYIMAEIEGGGYNAAGAGDDFFSFVGAVPPAGVTLTVVSGANSHGVNYSDLSADAPAAPSNAAPTFDNLPSDGVLHIDENESSVINIDTSDADGDHVTYSIVGGADASSFTIDPNTGQLNFVNAPDYENPTDGGGNNVYDVTVRADDGNGGVTEETLWVKVKDVDEGTGECIVIEAEHMNKYHFNTVHGSQASGGELVRLNCLGGNGDLSTTFGGTSGIYDLTIFAQDETDGQSAIMVKVNGHLVGTVTLNQDGDGIGSNNGGFSEFTLQDLNLNTGDTVQLWAQGDSGEWVRIDKIELCKDGEVCDEKLDFEGLARGTVVDTQFAGVTISAQRNTDNTAANDAMIFDSNNPTGGDHDLGYTGRGNILIISEDNDSSDPDDAIGGSITFDFDAPSDLKDIVLLDIEENGGTIVLTKEDGSTVTIAIPAAGNNSAQTVTLNTIDVTQMVINLAGSGAVDDLCWTPGEAPQPGSLSGTYFFDADRDGLDNDGDNGISGVTVELLDENGNGTGITVQTDADGNYSFGGLVPGDYGVKFTDTATGRELTTQNVDGDVSDDIDSDAGDIGGGMSTITGITVNAGQDTPDNDAGVVVELGSLSGTYFFDADRDGLDNDGDNGISGVTVELLDENGNGTGITVQTDADGNYSFGGLVPGDYGVKFTDTATGRELTTQNVDGDVSDDIDSDAGDIGGGMSTITGITVNAGQDTPDNDAGVVEEPGSLSGTYFMDTNRDGDDDGAAAGDMDLSGLTVTLLNADGSSATDIDGNPVAPVLTDGQGNYSFGNLAAGDYKVMFEEAAGKEFIAQDAAADDVDSDVDPANGMTGVVTVVAGEETTDVDAGAQNLLGSLSGKYFMDIDRDDVDSAGDMGIAGIVVTLLDAAGDPTGATTVTDGAGNYSFGGLEAGDYGVTFTDPTGALDGKELVNANVGGDDTVDSDALGNTVSSTITGISVVGGAETPDNDAGAKSEPGSLSGTYFMDTNRDGDDDGAAAGDMDVAGKTVKLLNADGSPAVDIDGNPVAPVLTDSNGNYSFANLAAGVYKVMFEGDDLKEFIAQDAAADDVDSDVDPATGMTGLVDVFAGQETTDVDAGIQDPGTASLGNKVFIDANNNGQQDAGEVGVDGVAVTLFKDGVEQETVVTSGGGMYLFDGLLAGDYTVEFEDVEEFDFTTPNAAGVADDLDSDAVPGASGAQTGTYTLGIGEVNLTVDAGLVSEDPDLTDDVAMTCADDIVMVDVLANDTDGPGQTLTITEVNGMAIVEGGAAVETAAGSFVSLQGGKLVIDGEAGYAALDIGETAVENISYTVSDGLGGESTANVEVTYKGDANSVESFADSFPVSGTYELEYAADQGSPFPDYAFDLRFLDTGDARFDGVLFEDAYCLDFNTAVRTVAEGGTANVGAIFGSQSAAALDAFDATTVSNANGLAGAENLDLINWVIAQDFEDQGFSGWEVQFAIWELADNFDASLVDYSSFQNTDGADVQLIVDGALALADASIAGVDSFTASVGDNIGLIVDPGTDDPENVQPFIVSLNWEDYDCIC